MLNVKKIRSDFPILKMKIYGRPLIYLDNAATTQIPQMVLDSISHHYRNVNGNIHRGMHYLSETASEAYENARHAVQKFINAPTEKEIIFSSGTTGAINLIASSFGQAFIKPGDEIIITGMEHHSNILPWRILCQQKGAVIKTIPMDPGGGLLLDKLPEIINEKTKLVACCHVSNALGLVNPVRRIVKLAQEKGIPVLIDGAQSVPHIPIDVEELDCDFFVFSGHKMYSLSGIGVLYGKAKYLEKMPPYQTGGGMVDQVGSDQIKFKEIPWKFEAGTPPVISAIGLARTIDYILDIGFDDIREYEDQLVNRALIKLNQIEGLTVYGNPHPRHGVISFNLAGVHHSDLSMVLDKMGIAVRSGKHCAQPVMNHFDVTGTVRASIAIYNLLEEIDALAESINEARKLLL